MRCNLQKFVLGSRFTCFYFNLIRIHVVPILMELEENQIGAINHGHPVMINQQ